MTNNPGRIDKTGRSLRTAQNCTATLNISSVPRWTTPDGLGHRRHALKPISFVTFALLVVTLQHGIGMAFLSNTLSAPILRKRYGNVVVANVNSFERANTYVLFIFVTS